MAAFKVGSKVETRGKNPRKCTIVDAIAKAEWLVEFEDGTTENKTSNQLQNRKTLAEAAKKVAAIILTPSKKKRKSRQRKDDDVSSKSDEDSPSDGDTPVQSKDDRSTSSSYNSEESELTPRPPTPPSAEREEVVVEDVVEEVEDDINDEDPDEGENEDVNLAETMHIDEAAVVDEDTERRNARKRKYLQEKIKLIEEAEEIVKRIQPKGLEVGALVETRKKDADTNEPERGMIVEKVWAEKGAGAAGGKKQYMWKVRLNSGEEKIFTSHQLKRQDGEGIRKYVWQVVETHYPDENNFDYDEIGVVGFDFSMFEGNIDCEAPDYKYPFAQLFQYLFPGDPREVVRRMNIAVRVENAKKVSNNKKNTKEFSLGEVMRGFGVILLAGPAEIGGAEKLFNKEKKKSPHANLPKMIVRGKIEGISHPRFEEFKRYLPSGFEGDDKTDPWYRINRLIEGFNSNRKFKVAASRKKVMDELMSAYRPRTSVTGGLPNISYIQRKPEPLGSEFKVVVCPITKIMLFVEIQRGKDAMNSDEYGKYSSEIGVTAAFVKRAVEQVAHCGTKHPARRESAEDNEREVFHGDSWFASINAAQSCQDMGHDFVGPVKTNTAGFPKEEIEAIMKDWPSGSSIVLEDKENKLVAIGYKYSLRSKILSFISTWNAGSTGEGKPYIARFPDKHGNMCEREVDRPELISDYFDDSDVVDSHNKSRQFDLALEKGWRTTDCWFRLITTFTGITATDSWNATRFHCTKESGFQDMSIKRFTECLVYDLLNKPWEDSERRDAIVLGVPVEDSVECSLVSPTHSEISWGSTNSTVVSRFDDSALYKQIKSSHKLVQTERKMSGGSGRSDRTRRTCSIGATGCTKPKKTSLECMHPDCMKGVKKRNSNYSEGIFICKNPGCLEQHQLQVFTDARRARH
ncbi:hypothetical protein ACHAWC_009713 [Mediolabrus comicus]